MSLKTYFFQCSAIVGQFWNQQEKDSPEGLLFWTGDPLHLIPYLKSGTSKNQKNLQQKVRKIQHSVKKEVGSTCGILVTPRAAVLQHSPRWQPQPWGRSRRRPARGARRPRPAGSARPPCVSSPAGSGGSPPGSACPPSAGRPGLQPPRSSPATRRGAKGSLEHVRKGRRAWGLWGERRGQHTGTGTAAAAAVRGST